MEGQLDCVASCANWLVASRERQMEAVVARRIFPELFTREMITDDGGVFAEPEGNVMGLWKPKS